jgi:hypothetical protein
MNPSTPSPSLSWSALLRWLRLLNTELDLHLAGMGGPIPRRWIEDRTEAAYRERDRRRVERETDR